MARYRDTETGRFVKEEVWERSVSAGGTRYVRETVHEAVQEIPEEFVDFADDYFDTGYEADEEAEY